MIKNGWINEAHTNVPGKDGELSYGGLCFPKDTQSLLNFLKSQNTPCGILEECIKERYKIRHNLNL